ncbi:MAG: peptidoglycan editing factor PgeF [Magnetococcales bacterium]|nr:peptidoglycan editing factor PgeF [Magnetococcales bacterium]
MMKKTHHCYSTELENQENMIFPWKNSAECPEILPFFTTRLGGVSAGSWAGFNLGDHVGDDPAHVARNRERLLAALAPHATELALVNQVHGDAVAIAGWNGPRPDADAVVTDRPGVVAAVLTADCAPVLFADPKRRIVAAAHAGWRGAVGGILENTVAVLMENGACREQLRVLIGPCIGAKHYEVSTDFREQIIIATQDKIGMDCQNFFSMEKKSARMHFDLPGYVLARLIKTGIDARQIINLEQCTYGLESFFFSHRRAVHRHQDPCGRQLSGILVVPPHQPQDPDLLAHGRHLHRSDQRLGR